MSNWSRKRERRKQETAEEWRKKRKSSMKRKKWAVWDAARKPRNPNRKADPVKKARRLRMQASQRANR